MSCDGHYILEYAPQDYVKPTPMQLDQIRIQQQFNHTWPTNTPKVEFKPLYGDWLFYFEMPKYTLLRETLADLKADQVFEATDCGQELREVKCRGGKPDGE